MIWKKFLIICCVVLVTIGSTSCVDTPDEKVVVDKSEGIAKDSIIPIETEIPKELNIPEYWDENVEINDGFVSLKAECGIDIGKIYNTPIYLYEIETMTDELLEKLCKYFSKGNQLYEYQEMTKQELNSEREKIVDQKGFWGTRIGPFSRTRLKELTEKIDVLIENAPDKKIEKNYIEDITFSRPYELELEYVQGYYLEKGWYGWYYDTEDEMGFTARVDTSKTIDPIIRATNYNEKIGSTTRFIYKQGIFIDELKLESDCAYHEAFETGGEEYLDYLTKIMSQEVLSGFSSQKAIEESKKILKDLSINDFNVIECVKAIGVIDCESWAGIDDKDMPITHGYSIYFSPQCGDLNGYTPPRTWQTNEFDKILYVPPFLPEQIHIIITEEGVQLFEWVNISKQIGVVADNTKLLTFDQIKEKLKDYLLFLSVAFGGETAKTEGYSYEYVIKNVQLRATNISAFDNPLQSWLVPVWVFDMEWTGLSPEGKKYEYTSILCMINAIDGGYIIVPYN